MHWKLQYLVDSSVRDHASFLWVTHDDQEHQNQNTYRLSPHMNTKLWMKPFNVEPWDENGTPGPNNVAAGIMSLYYCWYRNNNKLQPLFLNLFTSFMCTQVTIYIHEPGQGIVYTISIKNLKSWVNFCPILGTYGIFRIFHDFFGSITLSLTSIVENRSLLPNILISNLLKWEPTSAILVILIVLSSLSAQSLTNCSAFNKVSKDLLFSVLVMRVIVWTCTR